MHPFPPLDVWELVDAAVCEPALAQVCRALRAALGGRHWRVVVAVRLRICRPPVGCPVVAVLPACTLDAIRRPLPVRLPAPTAARSVALLLTVVRVPPTAVTMERCLWAEMARRVLDAHRDDWMSAERHPALQRFSVHSPCGAVVGAVRLAAAPTSSSQRSTTVTAVGATAAWWPLVRGNACGYCEPRTKHDIHHPLYTDWVVQTVRRPGADRRALLGDLRRLMDEVGTADGLLPLNLAAAVVLLEPEFRTDAVV